MSDIDGLLRVISLTSGVVLLLLLTSALLFSTKRLSAFVSSLLVGASLVLVFIAFLTGEALAGALITIGMLIGVIAFFSLLAD